MRPRSVPSAGRKKRTDYGWSSAGVILLAMLGWAGVLGGRIREIPAVIWGAMGLWCLLILWLLRQFRHRRRS